MTAASDSEPRAPPPATGQAAFSASRTCISFLLAVRALAPSRADHVTPRPAYLGGRSARKPGLRRALLPDPLRGRHGHILVDRLLEMADADFLIVRQRQAGLGARLEAFLLGEQVVRVLVEDVAERRIHALG